MPLKLLGECLRRSSVSSAPTFQVCQSNSHSNPFTLVREIRGKKKQKDKIILQLSDLSDLRIWEIRSDNTSRSFTWIMTTSTLTDVYYLPPSSRLCSRSNAINSWLTSTRPRLLTLISSQTLTLTLSNSLPIIILSFFSRAIFSADLITGICPQIPQPKSHQMRRFSTERSQVRQFCHSQLNVLDTNHHHL